MAPPVIVSSPIRIDHGNSIEIAFKVSSHMYMYSRHHCPVPIDELCTSLSLHVATHVALSLSSVPSG